MLEVTAPSMAFSVDTSGCGEPCGHNVKKPRGPGDTTVAFITYDCAAAGAPQAAAPTFRSLAPLNGSEPAGLRVSSTRQGVRLCSDSPPGPGGAKYPLTSMTTSEGCETNTEISPFVPAGTMAAFAVTAPVTAFSVETRGCVCPDGHVVRKPRGTWGTAVKFTEYACAVAGILQALESSGKDRATLAAKEGPPKAPAARRVSTRRQGVMGKKAMAVVSVSGTKYPLMSSTRSVSLEAKKHAAPFVPAGRMAATALVRPSMDLRLDASGWVCPQGKAVRNPSAPCGTTVMFNEYACAVFGIPQALLGMANALAAALPWRKGPPNGPVALRVSA